MWRLTTWLVGGLEQTQKHAGRSESSVEDEGLGRGFDPYIVLNLLMCLVSVQLLYLLQLMSHCLALLMRLSSCLQAVGHLLLQLLHLRGQYLGSCLQPHLTY